MNADLFDACLICAVIQCPFNFWVCCTLQYARLLQLVLIVQQSIHELLHLQKNLMLSQSHQIVCCIIYRLFFHLYDSDLAVVFLDGLIEILHHSLKFVRFLIHSGCFGQV